MDITDLNINAVLDKIFIIYYNSDIIIKNKIIITLKKHILKNKYRIY